MAQMRIREVAALLRVSDDTVRRWVDQGRLPARDAADGRMSIDGAAVAAFVRGRPDPESDDAAGGQISARNRLAGIVTDVRRDGLVAQVEIQAGPFRMVSLMTREAVDELGLEVGSLASAVVKATNVMVERTGPRYDA